MSDGGEESGEASNSGDGPGTTTVPGPRSDSPEGQAPETSPEADTEPEAADRPGTGTGPTARGPAGIDRRSGGRGRTDPSEYTTGRRSLSPTIQIQWGIRMVVGVLVVGVLAAFGLQGLGVDPLFAAALVGVLLILGSAWVVLHYRIWVYQVRDDAIYLERGVLTHVRTLVPYVRIQHVDTSRGPIERALGLSTLVVYTAGSRGADVSIPGLRPDEASDLQQRVKELAIEAEGDDAL